MLSALSHALDLTEGAPMGHTMRSCLVGMRIGREIGLGADDLSALYYALLLKDAGCSANASRMAALFGADDGATKARMKFVDWHRRVRLAVHTAMSVAPGKPLLARARQFMTIARTKNMTRELITLRCERGARIATGLGFPERTATAIRSLDEHWSGLGYAEGLAGDAIPLLARIANLAQTVEAFHAAGGPDRAIAVAEQRRESWFDPALVRVVTGWRRDRAFWDSLCMQDVTALVLCEEPADRMRYVDQDGLDEVARTFAGIIDAKSPFTFEHSMRVGNCAAAMGRLRGFSDDEIRRLYRAGLLHDIGKLGVSNRILDKAGPLNAEERIVVERHPLSSFAILERVAAFRDVARMAALHHEKLDGSGYPHGERGDGLDASTRCLIVADIYDALTTDRPYRITSSSEQALKLLDAGAGTKLCPDAIAALKMTIDQSGFTTVKSSPGLMN
ncbi:MAG TPA: HD domain-containing phosphohydrolase [Gemmatimonadaceae bacterium]